MDYFNNAPDSGRLDFKLVGVIVTKEEETTENSFVKARKVLVINSGHPDTASNVFFSHSSFATLDDRFVQ